MAERPRIIRQFDAGSMLAALILLAIVGLGPIYFGSVLPRERIALQAGGFLALAAVLAGRKPLSELRHIAIPALAVAAIGVVGLLQSLAWPRFLVQILSSHLVTLWDKASLLTGAAVDTLPLSLAPAVSRSTAIHWLALAACMAAACAVGRERGLRRILAISLLAVAIFEIVYGSDNWFAQRNSIFGMEVGGDPTRIRGTFVNPDHLALLLIIATTLGFSWLWWSVRRIQRQATVETRLLHAVLPSMLFLLLFVGLAFTGSRAGLVAIIFAILSQTMMLAIHYRRWQVGLLYSGVLAIGLGGILLFGLQKGLGRLLDTSAYELTLNARPVVYRASWELWQLFPWTGTGLGTFRQAFPLVQPTGLERTWIHAHSDVLELLVTTGLIGLPVMACGLLVLVRRLWAVFQLGHRSEDRAAGLGALGAIIGTLLHSIFDFGLTLPANAFIFATVCGLACGAATRKVKPRKQ